MDFLKNLNLKTSTVLKTAGLTLLVIIALVFSFRLIGSSFSHLSSGENGVAYSVSSGMPSYDYATKTEDAAIYAKSSAGSSMGLSIRNAASAPGTVAFQLNSAVGNQAEAFEVTQYYANIETRRLNETCSAITALKPREDVIFENANEYDQGCNYTFKVKKDKVEEILAIVKNLNPRELNDNTYTIKNLVDDYTSQIDILKNKLASIDDTMDKSVSAYDQVTALATRTQDVESLAKIIDSKINIIERLTQERININSQLESIERAKAEQLDRLEYTYFSVNIFESKFVDMKNLKDSWKSAIKTFVRDINIIFQDITVGLVTLLFLALQYAIYLLILLFVAKYGWQLVKYIWNK